MRSSYLALALSLALPSAALAGGLGNGVWVDCHHGNAFCPEYLDGFQQALAAVGADVTIETELDDAVADGSVRLVVLMRPLFELDYVPAGAPPPDYLTPFLASGGRLVLLGDTEGDTGSANSNAIIRGILADLPANDLVLGDQDHPMSCAAGQADVIEDHPLTEGLTDWRASVVNEVSGGTPLLKFFATDGFERNLATVQDVGGGSVVLFGDLEGFSANCWANGGEAPKFDWSQEHAPLWQNLFTVGFGPVDEDGDGSPFDVDCDDHDPTVGTTIAEDCGDGVDNDCDGDVDGDDSDCASDDDDAGDDDAGDDDTTGDDDAAADDDDLAVPDDDDLTLPGNNDGGTVGCCRSDVSDAGRPTTLLIGLALLFAGVRRRP
jgi:hypothetical protein